MRLSDVRYLGGPHACSGCASRMRGLGDLDDDDDNPDDTDSDGTDVDDDDYTGSVQDDKGNDLSGQLPDDVNQVQIQPAPGPPLGFFGTLNRLGISDTALAGVTGTIALIGAVFLAVELFPLISFIYLEKPRRFDR